MCFSSCHSIKAKKILYITLIRSQLTYCSQLWNPYLIKDTITLEKIQRQATKFILKDYDTDYRTRLLKLDLLPLMYTLDFYDIMFFIKALKQPSNHFNIYDHVSLALQTPDLPLTINLIMSILLTISLETSTSIEYQDYGINYHPSTQASHYHLLKPKSTSIYINTSYSIFQLTIPVHIIFVVDVVTVTM